MNFNNFMRDMYPSYLEHVAKHGEKDTTIEREDVNGDYCKENCRWATMKEQFQNRSYNRQFVAINSETGERHYGNNVKEMCSRLGMKYNPHIHAVLKGKRKQTMGFTFKYI
jgi:hypothetical protein